MSRQIRSDQVSRPRPRSSLCFLSSASSDEPDLRCSKNNIPRARLRTLKMSVVIVLCFIICWTPYYLLGLWYWFFPDDLEGKVSHSLTHMLFIFGLFNACVDPVIYGLFTIRFRRGLSSCYHRAVVLSERGRCSGHGVSLKGPAASRQCGPGGDTEEEGKKSDGGQVVEDSCEDPT